MKNLLVIISLSLLLSCQSQNEKNIKACIEDLKKRTHTFGRLNGKIITETEAIRICEMFDRDLPENFKKYNGVMLDVYTNFNISGGY